MSDNYIDELLSDLERQHQDELEMIYQFDLTYFSTDYLQELYAKWSDRQEHLRIFYKKILWFGILSPLWFVLGIFFITTMRSSPWGAIIILFPFSVAAYLGGMIHLMHRYGGMRHQEEIGLLIQLELQKRAMNQKTFF